VKVAFIGSHGVGKTTLCYALAARLKSKDVVLDIVSEVARSCPLPINERTSVEAQSWILHTQIANEIRAAAGHPVVICDRSVLDNYVYLLLAAGPQPALEGLVREWMGSYDLLVHVPIVGRPHADGMRATDPGFQRSVDARLLLELHRRELRAFSLDALERDRWVDAVEAEIADRIGSDQLPLL
jgi:nicotinamide riboside kinase